VINTELQMAGINKPTLEWENQSMDDFKRVDDLISAAYKLLNLISFYTIKGGKEVRAWALPKGGDVIEAAERVHTDFADKFIKAQVIGVKDLIKSGGWQVARDKGRVRTEGREYVVKHGDVIEFLHAK